MSIYWTTCPFGYWSPLYQSICSAICPFDNSSIHPFLYPYMVQSICLTIKTVHPSIQISDNNLPLYY